MATFLVSQFKTQGDTLIAKASDLGFPGQGEPFPNTIDIVFPRVGVFAYTMDNALLGGETPDITEASVIYVSYEPVVNHHRVIIMNE